MRTFATITLVTALAAAAPARAQSPATVYHGGDILTMVGDTAQYAEAIVVRDGKIAFVGAKAAALQAAGAGAAAVDLAGKTLLPGFIDAHGHFMYVGKNLMDADLFGSRDVAEVLARMKAHGAKVPKGAWIVGFGYQARQLAEARTPTIAELDTVSSDVPVLIVDSSGHLGAGNSAAFKAAGISGATPDPTGGTFARQSDGKALAGPMEETALNAVRSKRPPFTGALADQVAVGATKLWASYGQTTAMDCGVGLGEDDIALFRNAIDKRLLPIDVYICAKDSATDATIAAAKKVAADYANAEAGSPMQRQGALVAEANASSVDSVKRLLATRPDLDRRYVNRVRLGGIKFWLDGSLDTAWMTQPYANNPPGKTGAYRAYPQIPAEVLDAAFGKYWTTNLQIHMHMNGDAAADQAIAAIEKAIATHGMRDHRPVFVHASYLRPDQIAKLKSLGAVPSFLFWSLVSGGDAAVKLWGEERGSQALAAATMVRQGVPFTLSHDAPISPQPSILTLVDAAVNRTTASGAVLGPRERISAYEALKAVTANAAFQIKEESTKGTLEPGKLADLVILDGNPLKVDPKTIQDLRVLQTIKEGTTVYTRPANAAAAVAASGSGSSLPCVHDDVPGPGLSAEARATLALLLAASEDRERR